MAVGVLEVLLVSARSLSGWTDFFSKTDAYVILSCGQQSHRSSTATNQGGSPVWNQRFAFPIDDASTELLLSIYDEDTISADDILGTVKIPLAAVVASLNIRPTAYNVVRPDGRYQGEIKVGLTFTPKKGQQQEHASSYQHGTGHSNGPYGSRDGGGWRAGT